MTQVLPQLTKYWGNIFLNHSPQTLPWSHSCTDCPGTDPEIVKKGVFMLFFAQLLHKINQLFFTMRIPTLITLPLPNWISHYCQPRFYQILRLKHFSVDLEMWLILMYFYLKLRNISMLILNLWNKYVNICDR